MAADLDQRHPVARSSQRSAPSAAPTTAHAVAATPIRVPGPYATTRVERDERDDVAGHDVVEQRDLREADDADRDERGARARAGGTARTRAARWRTPGRRHVVLGGEVAREHERHEQQAGQAGVARDRAFVVPAGETRNHATEDKPQRGRGEKRARGIEPPSLAWEANVLAIGQRPRRASKRCRPRAEVPSLRNATPRVLACHRRRRAARGAARVRPHDHRDGHDAGRRGGRGRAGRAARRDAAAAARRGRHRLARRLQGQGRPGQRLGVVVRPVRRRAAAGAEDAQDDAGERRDRRSGST